MHLKYGLQSTAIIAKLNQLLKTLPELYNIPVH